ncbi:MAG: mannose-1-phosphate guanylyltransferase/mannose-6-phosphate isomerase [Gammaproteobacteria bacterium]|nr:mannose-1-phosphate guanylyltransferase/mannose-6-phosphate isomerase [Gammaproteobacteria bacterium]
MAIVPVILCGGVGSRLWPASRDTHPKPFIKPDNKHSLLQLSLLRAAALPDITRIMTVTNRELFHKIQNEYKEALEEQNKNLELSFILEPFGRNTAPAIAMAALDIIDNYDETAILLVLTADHLIKDQQAFAKAVDDAGKLAESGKIVTFGIKPTSPATGYGYIKHQGNSVLRFAEKPDLKTAKEFLASGDYLWNSGMFCARADVLISEMAEHCPNVIEKTKNCLASANKKNSQHISSTTIDSKTFELVPKISFDYALMEKTTNAAVVPCSIGWSDIGCWRALGDLIPGDQNNNRIQGNVLVKNSKNCTIKSEDRFIGAVGVENLVVVDSENALLIANKNNTQEVKEIYEHLKEQDSELHKHHATVIRPWGNYKTLAKGQGYLVKQIVVNPGAQLSLQLHNHRNEHWVVVSGKAKVINHDKELILEVDQSAYIKVKHKHRVENIGTEPLIIIETQTGSYLGEDDIVRFEDKYGRTTN